MQVIWDPAKAEMNPKKHRVHFSDAEAVLFDPLALTAEDQDVKGERRFVTLGSDATGRVLVVVYTYRGETIRLISARKATPGERKDYEKGI
jgi:uncharacterized DUF497 family protein